jgi:hypothetical protein
MKKTIKTKYMNDKKGSSVITDENAPFLKEIDCIALGVLYDPYDPEEDLNSGTLEKLEKLKECYVIFPGVISPPIKLGVVLEATVQIGDDEPQHRRLISATLLLDISKSKFLSISIGENNIILHSESVIPRLQVNPVRVFDEFVMYPISSFAWYGSKRIIITNVKECPEYFDVIKPSPYKFNSNTKFFSITGNLIGRRIYGSEIFK